MPSPFFPLALFNGKLYPLDTDTNKTLLRYPSIYLMAALMQAEGFLIDDPRLPVWSSQYQAALAGIGMEVAEQEYSGSTVQVQNTYRGRVK